MNSVLVDLIFLFLVSALKEIDRFLLALQEYDSHVNFVNESPVKVFPRFQYFLVRQYFRLLLRVPPSKSREVDFCLPVLLQINSDFHLKAFVGLDHVFASFENDFDEIVGPLKI